MKADKNNSPLVSIIVPAYNVEKYLAPCIESVAKQSDGRMEMILVNDGSADSTERLCREYAEKYGFIRFFSKENGGLSQTRNFAIREARGEYVSHSRGQT